MYCWRFRSRAIQVAFERVDRHTHVTGLRQTNSGAERSPSFWAIVPSLRPLKCYAVPVVLRSNWVRKLRDDGVALILQRSRHRHWSLFSRLFKSVAICSVASPGSGYCRKLFSSGFFKIFYIYIYIKCTVETWKQWRGNIPRNTTVQLCFQVSVQLH